MSATSQSRRLCQTFNFILRGGLMDNEINDPILPEPKLDEGYGGVYWYQQGDVEACHLLTQASKRVKARRSMAYRHKTRESN